MSRGVYPRRVRTALPADGWFRFQAVTSREGPAGLRLTVPAPVARGMEHLGWAGRRVRLRVAGLGEAWADVRWVNPRQRVVALPAALGGRAGELVDVALAPVLAAKTYQSE